MENFSPDRTESTSFDTTDDFTSILNELRIKEGDELVQEFIKIFKNRIPADIEYLIAARKNQNLKELKQKVHFLSTTLLTLKFQHGLSLASQIENAIDANDSIAARSLTNEFIDYLNDALNTIS